ncbi:hypothetical protein MCOR27_004072 [Pyricularia oryzae]|uniref:Uncharacterized protein n=5 Tax=Pyricularia TaxID=48558 RepID=A0ABQ8N9C8_PYRGI|nr:uncharacterized protein MGG_06419 [Pyricularia oryzae 70-15]ELQ44410.1 hypothetical protein OOU_Y34scaffold00088g50 [Pyricularia oryzae Y34]KAH8843430.1 hypothetical protein MCOR01_004241 [Pyricularia oryzae]KAI6293409.1 hypothetical protein MCOR33_009165 [Pyricularia grisea]EHA50830.1 hypothetical protein MGG_06419 [Pyricularia oryzae 70-15]KAI6252745.1 hypothetical protein MCOR19_010647 [Pyricularia oryzae]
MSAAIAMAPSPAPHDRPSFPSDLSSPSNSRTASAPSQLSLAAPPNATTTQRSGSGSPRGSRTANGPKSSPPSASRNGVAPKIVVKKEPGSPEHAPRRRPGRLDLSKGGSNAAGPSTARPLTARDGLGIQEVGLACLSPGFVTQDPVMKEQLQRSMSVREQQRHIIEARLQQQSAKGDGPDHTKDKDGGNFAAKTPGISSRRNKAPPGLSIVAPSHEQFAHERVIQSAPLGQTFTGMQNSQPLTRHITNQPSKLSNTSHIHHVPATQTNNRLPPISDVFGQGLSGHPESGGHAVFAQQSAARAPPASPGHAHLQQMQQAQHQQPPHTSRPREYKSAEEAQQELAGGRPELLPKIVHYGGHQPPTPPSPQPGQQRSSAADPSRSASRRRTRAEYEEGASPPLGTGRGPRRMPFGEGRDSPESQRAKREEFLRLCERAWDLFHS